MLSANCHSDRQRKRNAHALFSHTLSIWQWFNDSIWYLYIYNSRVPALKLNEQSAVKYNVFCTNGQAACFSSNNSECWMALEVDDKCSNAHSGWEKSRRVCGSGNFQCCQRAATSFASDKTDGRKYENRGQHPHAEGKVCAVRAGVTFSPCSNTYIRQYFKWTPPQNATENRIMQQKIAHHD